MANKKVFNPLGMPFDTVRDDIADLTTRNASDVVNTPAGDIVAINVQTAINELDTEKVPYTGGTGNVDIGDFELRAQTLESDVATGTAPFTIASTTVNTNLNADLLDGLHDTGYTKTTAGQTINVATAAELTAALATLASAPSLLGNIIIQLTADITTDITIPVLVYNGFTVTIQGALTEIESGIACTNVKPVIGASYGTLTRSAGTWTVNEHQDLIAYDGTDYYVIRSNTDTILYHANQQQAAGAKTISIYDWTYTLTGKVITDDSSKLILNKLKVVDNSSSSDYLTGSLVGGTYSYITTILCSINQLGGNPIVYLSGFTKLIMNYSIFVGVSYGFRVVNISYVETLYKNSGLRLTNANTGRKTGMDFSLGSSSYLREGYIYSSVARAASGNMGINNSMSKLLSVYLIADNWDTGFLASNGGVHQSIIDTFINNGTNKNPAAAADPSYIS